ncbi:MAG: FAD-dependent oxidoreductase [Candidatus Nanoarchaeia archaeon]
MEKAYDLVIVGAGVSGTALLYALACYSDVKRIAIIEKYDQAAAVNSHHNNNSQTLHFGDIETNYTVEKAARVKEAAVMVQRYVEKHKGQLFHKTHKMVLAVGHAQSRKMEKRYKEFKHLFPKLKIIRRKEIAKIEPKVVEGRDPNQEILALYTPDGYIVNYRLLAESFIDQALKAKGKKIDVVLGTCVDKIEGLNGKYRLYTPNWIFTAPVVVDCSGSNSLIHAKSLGIGKELGLLPVAGSFFGTKKKMLNGKVYTLQMKKLPFAAIHGDPAVTNLDETRFGPTAKVLPLLERHKWKTMPDFLRTSIWNIRGVLSLLKIISDPILLKYVIRNLVYDMPFIGKRVFIKEIRKIIPNMKLKDLKYRKGFGGIRPQLVDTKAMKLNMGEAKLTGPNIIFNITPSPGASVCLDTAHKDAVSVAKMLGAKFNSKAFLKGHS